MRDGREGSPSRRTSSGGSDLSHERLRERAWRLATALEPPDGLLDRTLAFHGPEPVGPVIGADAYRGRVVEPLMRALPDARKEPYLFLAGEYRGGFWAAATGNLVGTMRAPWAGIPASGETRSLRFGEFYRFDGDRICEIRCLYDILGLAAQSGIRLLPPFGGADGIPPGSRRVSAPREDAAGPADTEHTFRLVKDMLEGCNRLVGSDLASQGMERYWWPDMVWHGPWGIGSAYGLDAFFEHAQGPSVRAFPHRRGAWPKTCYIAEGRFAAQTGWPSLVGVFNGEPFRGIRPTGGPIGQNVMDFYVRDGDLIAENWVLIDLVKFGLDCGVDLMARMPEDPSLPTGA